ncbi:MAG: phosphate ABC transporter substrate-binding protein [Epsilonproteobacteria bacterium]|nr:phosphate ABC transporter substrate-binding protein [Campylobacterota bacterium]
MLFSSIFLTADIKVITSSRSPIGAISKEQLIKIYLKEIDRINGVEVVPIDNSDTKVYNEFYEKLINKSPKQIHAYWMKEIYRGDKQPPKRLSDDEIRDEIEDNPAIIYYSYDKLTGKIVLNLK